MRMWGRDSLNHYCHRCEYSLTIGRPLGLGVPKQCVRRSVGSEKCGKGSSVVMVVCLFVSLFKQRSFDSHGCIFVSLLSGEC